MADFFGVKKSDIIEPSDDTDISASVKRPTKSTVPLNCDETKLLSNYRNINGNNRQAIDVMIALFLSQQSSGDNFGHTTMAM